LHAGERHSLRGHLQRTGDHRLIPLALKGVQYRAIGAGPLLRRNLLIYGLGGIIVPFIGIKAIDLLLAVTGLA
jgi:K+-transporting ATPase ATPase B chain